MVFVTILNYIIMVILGCYVVLVKASGFIKLSNVGPISGISTSLKLNIRQVSQVQSTSSSTSQKGTILLDSTGTTTADTAFILPTSLRKPTRSSLSIRPSGSISPHSQGWTRDFSELTNPSSPTGTGSSGKMVSSRVISKDTIISNSSDPSDFQITKIELANISSDHATSDSVVFHLSSHDKLSVTTQSPSRKVGPDTISDSHTLSRSSTIPIIEQTQQESREKEGSENENNSEFQEVVAPSNSDPLPDLPLLPLSSLVDDS